MLSDFHTHTTFCDGENTPEEIVLYAIDNGFASIGFSGHGYTSFDLRYCMKDKAAYISEINRLKKKYKNKIQVYTGVEEDAFSPVNRSDFDYIIGSSHYFLDGETYYPIDSSYDYFKKCLELFKYDIITLSETYYSAFCDYILKRKPDIVGHFDVITKFDMIDTPRFLSNPEYLKIADKYMTEAVKSDVIFEVNTGAIARGLRTTPYPHENLLYLLKKHNGKLILSSDSHRLDTLTFNFDETKKFLRDIGFEYVYTIYDNEFKKDYL
ncbi:MAG: histidinol-phosphatase [Clostridia bacterium]|nr:histidinol-phosphatase [Clostridia bacterium]